MRCPAPFIKVSMTFFICLFAAPIAGAQSSQARAFIVDDRLSALRRDPDIRAEVIQRLRLGRAVHIVGARSARADQPGFYRIAVTRRTRGWIHESAVAVPGRSGEDRRVSKLVASLEGIDRLSLCRLFRERFSRSPLLPRVLLAFAEEAERSADALGPRARRRLAGLDDEGARAGLRDYYLSDPGLDRYSKLGIRFEFDESSGGYIYDGQAYREIVRRFPASPEATRARELLREAVRKRPSPRK